MLLHLVCPGCGVKNRIPAERRHEQPVCGRCGAELMAATPVPLADAALAGFIVGTELPVLVDFWAAWCGPCKTMAPHFEAAAKQLPDVRFVKVDTDAAPNASARYGIRSIPTLILFDRGQQVGRLSGAMSAQQLVDWVRGQLPAGGIRPSPA